MSARALQAFADPFRAASLRVRWSSISFAAFVVAGTLGFASLVILSKAKVDRQAIEERAVVAAQNVTHAIDQEIAAVEFLLQGLVTSPALQSGDFDAFRKQLAATPTPSGTWFVLMDDRQQLINTRLADGAKLPAAPGVLQRIRDRGYGISNRFAARSAPGEIVSVSMLVNDAGGEPKYNLSYTLSEQRLSDLVKRARLSDQWQTAVFDRDYNPIINLRPQTASNPGATRDPWADAIAGKIGSGIVPSPAGAHAPVLLAYSRSAISGWTAATGMPLAAVRAPVNTALAQILAGGAVLLGLGSLVAGLLARRIERPIETLRKTATRAEDQLRTAEDALQTTQARYRTYWEHTAECLFAVRVTEDGEFFFEGLNPAHARLSGLSSTGIGGKTPHQCLPADAADIVSAHYRECVQAGKAISYEEVLGLPGGVRRWQTTLAPVRDADTGRISLILGSSRDITRDREATEEISRGRRLLERIAKASPEFIYVFDLRARKVDFISARVYDAVGYTPEQVRALKDRVLEVLVHPDDLPRVLAYLDDIKALPDAGVASINARLAHKNEGYRWFTSSQHGVLARRRRRGQPHHRRCHRPHRPESHAGCARRQQPASAVDSCQHQRLLFHARSRLHRHRHQRCRIALVEAGQGRSGRAIVLRGISELPRPAGSHDARGARRKAAAPGGPVEHPPGPLARFPRLSVAGGLQCLLPRHLGAHDRGSDFGKDQGAARIRRSTPFRPTSSSSTRRARSCWSTRRGGSSSIGAAVSFPTTGSAPTIGP